MGKRLDLQALLENLPGVQKAYFQPPPNLVMVYPCIVYSRDQERKTFANNSPYNNTKRYQVTVIDKDPDTEIPDAVSALALCSFSRYLVSDNLNHYIYSLYF